MATIKLHVDQVHIDAATKLRDEATVRLSDGRMGYNVTYEAVSHCPLALAFKAQYPSCYVEVTRHWWETGREYGPLSKRAQKMVRDFDARRPVKPASFLLTVSRTRYA